jgi:hypothetical protein
VGGWLLNDDVRVWAGGRRVSAIGAGGSPTFLYATGEVEWCRRSAGGCEACWLWGTRE